MESRKRFLIWFWGLFTTFFLFIFVLFTLITKGFLGHMPTFEELENPKSNLASEIYSADSVLLGTFFLDNRSYVEFRQLSPNLVNALISIEDKRYKAHSGIDFRGLARVFFKTFLLSDQSSGGGSTITQQLAKLLFHDRPNSTFERVKQKLKEWVIAVKLERSYTKEELMAMYLSQIDFINNAVGIKSASRIYFNTTTDALKIEQAALLVGMIKNPSIFNPLRNEDVCFVRRNVVLHQMYRYGYMTRHAYDSLSALPLKLNYKKEDHNTGSATYFREYLRMIMNRNVPQRSQYYNQRDYEIDSIKWVKDGLYGWCNKNKKPDGTSYNLYKDGLKIYTTINSKLQKYAEEAVKEHLSKDLQLAFYKEKGTKYLRYTKKTLSETYLISSIKRSERYYAMRRAGFSEDEIMKAFRKPVKMSIFSWNGDIDTVMSPLDSLRYYKYILHAGFMSINPSNGHVKTYVGGINFKQFKYDHVAVSKRQVGSTFKPFLYVLAMQEGYSPCRQVDNVQQTFVMGPDSVYQPKSSGSAKFFGKKVTLKWGLATSENNISAWLLKQFNPQSVVNIAYKMGIESEVLPVLSMIYGTSNLSVCEMVSAYSTFANKGVHVKPVFVTTIKDRKGNIITKFVEEKEESISEETAARMLYLMQGVCQGWGTATRLRYKYNFDKSIQIAGKTGTTQDHGDGWFIGLVPNLISGVWVGAEDSFVHFSAQKLGEGANMALPIWAYFMKKVFADSTLDIKPTDGFDIDRFIANDKDCSQYDEENDVVPEVYEMPDGSNY